MKAKHLLLIILFLFVQNITSQNFKPGDIVSFSANVSFTAPAPFHALASTTNAAKYALVGAKYRIINPGANTTTLMALPYKLPTKKMRENRVNAAAKANPAVSPEAFNSDKYNNIVFTVANTDLAAFAKVVEYEDRLAVGLLSLPFKARPQNGMTFDTEFNLNLTLNTRIGSLLGSSFNWQIGAGIGSVGLNTSNASGLTGEQAQDVALLTGLTGLMLQYKRVQVGLYAGVDFINNQKEYNWESNGNMWLGFGVGYDLFQISASPNSSNQGN